MRKRGSGEGKLICPSSRRVISHLMRLVDEDESLTQRTVVRRLKERVEENLPDVFSELIVSISGELRIT